MERFRHVVPNESHEEISRDFVEEFISNNSDIHGTGSLDENLDNYQGWLRRMEELRNIESNEELVPEDIYFLFRESDNRIVGMFDLRRELNERLTERGGQIGYCIRPSERGNGYNLINLYMGLLRCQELGLEEVTIDVDDWNTPSYRTVERLNGVILNTYYDEEDHCLVRRYVINVNQTIEEYRNVYEPQIVR